MTRLTGEPGHPDAQELLLMSTSPGAPIDSSESTSSNRDPASRDYDFGAERVPAFLARLGQD